QRFFSGAFILRGPERRSKRHSCSSQNGLLPHCSRISPSIFGGEDRNRTKNDRFQPKICPKLLVNQAYPVGTPAALARTQLVRFGARCREAAGGQALAITAEYPRDSSTAVPGIGRSGLPPSERWQEMFVMLQHISSARSNQCYLPSFGP